MQENNDDQIIIEGLKAIRQGILAADWATVAAGYSSITGEEILLPQKPKSKLERIREAMSSETPKEEKVKKPRGKKKEEKPKEPAEDDDITVVTTKEQGGKRFAINGFNVVSTETDFEEIEKNKKLASQKTKMPRSKESIDDLKKQYDTTNQDRSIGYHDKPKRPPEGR